MEADEEPPLLPPQVLKPFLSHVWEDVAGVGYVVQTAQDPAMWMPRQ